MAFQTFIERLLDSGEVWSIEREGLGTRSFIGNSIRMIQSSQRVQTVTHEHNMQRSKEHPTNGIHRASNE